jgi:hypothetical protein
MNKACTCCGATSHVQSVSLCQDCQAAPRVAAVARKLAGPINWHDIVGAVLYDQYGHPVALVRSIDFRQESLDITTFGGQPSQMPGLVSIRIEAEGIPG